MSARSHPIPDNAQIAVDDTLLILAIQSRDRAELERLYLSYHGRLARFLVRITKRPGNIEEIINDTFMRPPLGGYDRRHVGGSIRRGLHNRRPAGTIEWATLRCWTDVDFFFWGSCRQ
jgi:hypothetical protein